jgi:hypothetical protein
VVDMVFSNGQKLSLSPENYLFRVSNGLVCICVIYIHTYIQCTKIVEVFSNRICAFWIQL